MYAQREWIGRTKKVIFHKTSRDRDHLTFRLLNGLEICSFVAVVCSPVDWWLWLCSMCTLFFARACSLFRSHIRYTPYSLFHFNFFLFFFVNEFRMCMHHAYKTAFCALIVARMRQAVSDLICKRVIYWAKTFAKEMMFFLLLLLFFSICRNSWRGSNYNGLN